GGTGGGDAPGGKGDAATPPPGPAVQKAEEQTGELKLLGPKDDENAVDPANITVQNHQDQTTDPQSPLTGDNKNSPAGEPASKIIAESTPLTDEPVKEDVDRKGPPDSDGVSSVAGRGTEEGIPNKTPQSEAAGKGGGKQAGNKNDATGEIPAETKGVNATAVIGNGERSPAAVTAATPDVGTESKPTTNDLRPPSTEGATQVSTTPDGNDASDSTEKAASQSVGYTTATKNATNSTNQTTTVESDSSTAVSHTTSPLLLL
ncbi:mucin-associated surface protein (MASP), putative, partial [Trypanosoma cruzi marinkellei]